jgi:hypothetical protein
MSTSSPRLALSHSHARAAVEEKHGVAQQDLRFSRAASIPPAAGIANVAESSLRALHQSGSDPGCVKTLRGKRTRNFEACGRAQSKKTQKFILRSLLRPNQISFSHSLGPLPTSACNASTSAPPKPRIAALTKRASLEALERAHNLNRGALKPRKAPARGGLPRRKRLQMEATPATARRLPTIRGRSGYRWPTSNGQLRPERRNSTTNHKPERPAMCDHGRMMWLARHGYAAKSVTGRPHTSPVFYKQEEALWGVG